jgi:hypothetical protein
MLRDAPMPAGMTLADLIERVRILCTVYDPETGEYRYDYAAVPRDRRRPDALLLHGLVLPG